MADDAAPPVAAPGPAIPPAGMAAFGRPEDLAPREARGHGAHASTPRLARNVDRLAEAFGLELGATGQGVRVDRLAADGLARDPIDGSAASIGSQRDHTPPGRIVTGFAGLEARTADWVAQESRAGRTRGA